MTTTEPTVVTEIPVPLFQRELETGLVQGVKYIRRPDGRIDWPKMIDPKYIVFNRKLDDTGLLEKTYGATAGKLVYSDVIKEQTVDDRHVLVLLMGFVELMALRGGSALPRIAHVTSYPKDAANVTCECTIQWIPNVEEPDGFISYGTADATWENTGGWGYLGAMAGNRAFVRAVRQGLRIPILGFDEIAKKDEALPETTESNSGAVTPHSILSRAADAQKMTFETVKTGALEKYRDKMEDDPTTWKKWTDVSPQDCLTLIKLIKSKKKN